MTAADHAGLALGACGVAKDAHDHAQACATIGYGVLAELWMAVAMSAAAVACTHAEIATRLGVDADQAENLAALQDLATVWMSGAATAARGCVTRWGT